MFLRLVRERYLRPTDLEPDPPEENATASAPPDDMDVDGGQQSHLQFALPCSAKNDGSDAVCHVFQDLATWNRHLWYVGLQLRELTAPGELSLVRLRDQGCGHEQVARSRDGRVLFHALLALHRCVVSLDLDEAIIEGAGLGECRDFVVGAFQMNTTLRKLSLGDFLDYNIVRQKLFAAVATKTRLHELEVVGSGVFQGMLNPIRVLLESSATNVTTLSIPGMLFDEQRARRLVSALTRNDTLLELSVHSTVLCSVLDNGAARFSLYVANNSKLQALTVTDDVDREKAAYDDVTAIVDALLPRGTILRLKLCSFLLDEACSYQFARLLARNGALENLDITACRWTRASPLSSDSTIAQDKELGPRLAGPHISRRVRSWLEAFLGNTNLKSLAINLCCLTAVDFEVFFQALMAVKSLSTVLVFGVAPEDLQVLGRVLQYTGMSSKVSVCDQYLVSLELLCSLEDCPEVLRHAAVSAVRAPCPDFCRETLLMLTTSRWSQVTTLRLFLSQEVLDDVTVQAMCKYLSEARALREFELGGCKDPDLSLLKGDGSLNLLLRALFSSPSVRALHLWRFRFGPANLRFLAEAVLTNRTLCEFSFYSWDSAENSTLLKFLAPDFSENETMLHLSVSRSAEVETQLERSAIQAVLGRNMGFVTCAAHFALNIERSRRCGDAFERVHRSSAVTSKVQELASVDEANATDMIRSTLAVS